MTPFRQGIPLLQARRVTIWEVLVDGRSAGNIIAARGSIGCVDQDNRYSSVLLKSTVAFGNGS